MILIVTKESLNTLVVTVYKFENGTSIKAVLVVIVYALFVRWRCDCVQECVSRICMSTAV